MSNLNIIIMADMVPTGAPNPYANSESGNGAGQTRSATAAAAIGIGSAVAGLIGSWISSNASQNIAQAQIELAQQTNEQNAFLQREANQWNWQMQQEQNDANLHLANVYNANQVELQNDMNEYNERMWNLANEYNSPANQLALARQAGINPNAALGFGNVSPVQQVTTPNQALPQGDVSRAVAPQMRAYDIPKGADYGEILKTAAEALQNWPMYREQLAGLREDVRRKRLENDEIEDANKLYTGASFLQNPNDAFDVITYSDYETLPDSEKKKYQTVSDDGKPLPNIVKIPFNSKSGYDAYVDILNLRRNIADAYADISQSKLKKMVADGQIADNKVVQALCDLPVAQYDELIQTTKKVIAETNRTEEETNLSGLRADYLQASVDMLKEQLQQLQDSSLTKYINKWESEGFEWSDLWKFLTVLASRSALLKR